MSYFRVHIPKSDDVVYNFENFNLAVRSIALTYSMSVEKPNIEPDQYSPIKWHIYYCGEEIGTIEQRETPLILTLPTHF